MARHRALMWTLAGLVLISLACNAFAGTPEPALPPPPALATLPPAAPATAAAAGDGAVATATLSPAETPPAGTAGVATLQALVDLNVRTGPGVNYDTDGFLSEGDLAVIIGQDPGSGWWQIACPERATGDACWVSGRAQYSAVSNAADVPVAVVPPTPTPAPQSVGTVVAYVENGRLFILPLDMSQSPPRPGAPRALGTRSDVQAVQLSPDGRRVAYVAGTPGENGLYVANVDGSDDRLLASSVTLQEGLDGVGTTNVEPAQGLIGAVVWAPDGRQILFNTAVRGQERSIVGTNTDLWRATIDGEVAQLFGVGDGGATLAVSRAGQVLLGQSRSLRRTTLDGRGSETVLTFPLVNTASEWIFYPQPQWVLSDSQAFVAIPGADPFAVEPTATLWLILPGEPAVQLGALPGSVLFNPVRWSPDGTRLVYVQQSLGGTAASRPALTLASADGEAGVAYHGAEELAAFGWSPDSTRFLYTGPRFYAIGQPGEAPLLVDIPAEMRVADLVWLDNAWFLAAIGPRGGGAWTLYGTDLAGNASPLHTVSAGDLVWDVWSP